jgi:hypothetical protein
MNVEIGTEAAQFPEKGYINEIFVAVRGLVCSYVMYAYGSYTWQSGHFSLIFLPMPVAVPPVPVPMTTMSTCPPHWVRISSAVVS